jgi:hypothetical protein
MGIKETEFLDANWIQMVQGRVLWRVFVKTVMNLRVP